jgi:hypothetical protein
MDHCDDSELDKLTRSLAAPPSSQEAAICFF